MQSNTMHSITVKTVAAANHARHSSASNVPSNENSKVLYKTVTPAFATTHRNVPAQHHRYKRPQSSAANTHRRDLIDKKASIDVKTSHQMALKPRPISAIKVYKSTSSRTMRAEIATADSTNEMTMFSMAGNSSQMRTIEHTSMMQRGAG